VCEGKLAPPGEVSQSALAMPQLETGTMRGSRSVVGVSVMGLYVLATGGQRGGNA